MSDTSQGPGWWQASDGRWYPPESHPNWAAQAFGPAPSGTVEDALASWAPTPATPWAGAEAGNPYGTGGSVTNGAPYGPGMGGPGMAGLPGPGHQPGGTRLATHQPMVATTSGGRFGRGIRLVGVGFAMARDEPGLMMVPVVAFVVQLVILAVAFVALYPAIQALHATSPGATFHLPASQWLVIVAAGVATMFVSVVSHATIIARVMARFHGQSVTNTQAARAALSKSPQLLAWAFINYVVMSILRNISDRGIIGLLIGSALRAGWFLASFFVVPVILFEHTGAVVSIKRSVALCRARWGENIVGNGALGLIGLVAVVIDVVAAFVLGSVIAPLGVVVGVVGLVGIFLVMTVASGAFNAALYWYAVTDQPPGQYALGDLQSAYRTKRRRTGIYGV